MQVLVLVLGCLCFVEGYSTAPSRAGLMARDSHERLNKVLWIPTFAEYEAMTRSLYTEAKSL